MITTESIKELRDATGISVMQCKKALEEAGGDREKALLILKKKSRDIALKKTDRTFGAGTVAAYIHGNGTVGAMVELLSETDFVAKNEEFRRLAYDIAMHVTASQPEFLAIGDVSEDARSKVKELFIDEVKSKPEHIREQILEGKLAAYFKERVLLEQSFIKNPDVTIGSLIESAVQKFGEKIAVRRFSRFAVLA